MYSMSNNSFIQNALWYTFIFFYWTNPQFLSHIISSNNRNNNIAVKTMTIHDIQGRQLVLSVALKTPSNPIRDSISRTSSSSQHPFLWNTHQTMNRFGWVCLPSRNASEKVGESLPFTSLLQCASVLQCTGSTLHILRNQCWWHRWNG